MTLIDFYTKVDDRLGIAARIVAKAAATHGSARVLTPDAATTDALELTGMETAEAGDGDDSTGGYASLTGVRSGRSEPQDASPAPVGGKDEGAPGPRGEGFYAAYFRDLDGNKLNCFCMG